MFKRLTTKVLFTISVISLAVFQTEGFAQMNHRSSSDHTKIEKAKRKQLSEKEQKEVIALLEANEALHKAYFAYEGKAVEKAAKRLSKRIESVSSKEIQGLMRFANGKLREIRATNDRETNNQNYHLVSMALIHLVNSYDVGDKYNAYSCPMVKKKWVQNSKQMAKVHNPYASGMPHCGDQDSHY